jgi:hypothetical protein
MHDHTDVYEDDFDYSQHTPIEVPVGPWDCIDRACEQYEGPDGSDLPDVTYCSHVTVLVLCSACSGASANHAIKNEIAWDDCILLASSAPADHRSDTPKRCPARGRITACQNF